MAEETVLEALKARAPKRSVLDEIRARAKEPTAGERVAGFGAGLVQGATDVAKGVFLDAPGYLGREIVKGVLPADLEARMQPEGENTLIGLSRRLDATRSLAPTSVQEEPAGAGRFLTTTLSQGIGSTGGFVAAGGFAGTAGAALSGALQNGSAAFIEAKASGADDKTARIAAMLGAGIGTSEAANIDGILERFAGKGALSAFEAALLTGSGETLQEAGQQLGNNLAASATYEPDRKALEGVAESGGAGGLSGFLLSIVGSAVGARRRGSTSNSSGLPVVANEGIPPLGASEPRAASPVDVATADTLAPAAPGPENAGQMPATPQEATSTPEAAATAPSMQEPALPAETPAPPNSDQEAGALSTPAPETLPSQGGGGEPTVLEQVRQGADQPAAMPEKQPRAARIAEIDAELDDLVKKIGRKSGKTVRSSGLDPETLKDVTHFAALHIERGVLTIGEFTTRAVERLGEAVRPYIEAAWSAARGDVQSGTNEAPTEGVSPPAGGEVATETQGPPPEGFDLPQESKFRRLYTGLVDDLERIKQAERLAPAKVQGKTVAETLQLQPGRKFGEVEKLNQRFLDPIQKTIKDAKIPPIESTDEKVSASDFLYALHAPERNALIQERHPRKFAKEPGSGMSNEDAAAIVEKALASPNAPAYRKLQRKNRALNRKRLDVLVESGLLSEEGRKEWEKFGKDYVPLRTTTEPGDVVFGSRSFNIAGKESKRAEGRSSRADSPLVFSLATAEQAIERAERNRVGLKVAELVKANPGGPWRIESDANQIKEGEQRLSYKDQGEQRYIVTSDKALADAFRRLEDPQAGVLKALDPINRWLRKVIIDWNPVFPLTNVPRDIGTAAVKSAIQGDFGATLGALKNALPAAKGAFRAIRSGTAKGTWEDVYRRARDAGALIGWTQPADFETRAQDFQKLVESDSPIRDKAKAFGDLIDHLNKATELGTRLAVFDALVKVGKSEAQAAVGARRVTADFARRGRWAPVYSRLFLFSGANVQGTSEMAEAIAKNPRRASAVLGALIGAGFGTALLSFMHGDDDELEKLSEEDKARFFGVMVGKKRYGVAAPYGFNVFPYLGWKLAEMTMQGKDRSDALGNVARAALDSMSPLPRGANLMQQATPTAARPFVEISQNRDFGNRPIAPEVDPFDPSPPPNVDRSFKGVSPISKGIAEGLFSGSGEAIDVSPEWIDHLAKAATGGLGTFAGRTSEVARKVIAGDTSDLRISDIPLARPFVQEASRGADSRLYYDVRAKIDEANDRSKKGRSLSDEQTRMLAIRPDLMQSERELKRMRAERNAAEQKRALELDGLILERQRAFLKLATQARKGSTQKP